MWAIIWVIAAISTVSACPAGRWASNVTQWEQVGNDVCDLCPVGRYRRAGMAVGRCVAAELGEYVPSEGATRPIACPSGRFSDEYASDSCESCALGRYAPESNSSACLSASSGEFVGGRGWIAPLLCPAGRFSGGNEASSCASCPTGRIAASPGASSCVSCGSGSFALPGSVACSNSSSGACGPGEELVSGICVSCQPGTYSSNGTECVPSPKGYFVPGRGGSSPSPCPPGQNAPSTGQSRCSDCPGDTFAPAGSDRCVPCPSAGARCDGGVLTVLDGFWVDPRSTPTATSLSGSTLHACVVPEACHLSVNLVTNDANMTCAKGYQGYVVVF